MNHNEASPLLLSQQQTTTSSGIHRRRSPVPSSTNNSRVALLGKDQSSFIREYHSQPSNTSTTTMDHQASRHEYHDEEEGAQRGGSSQQQQQPLLEIPEEVYEVRKAALQVLKPLTKTWLIMTIGGSISVLLGMARWTQVLGHLPVWFILTPLWTAHVALAGCHVVSAKALAVFIATANDARQRPDSRDHLDRTEYLPLLQRSLKFGCKTGLLSFCFFLTEWLLYWQWRKYQKTGNLPSIALACLPLWILVVGGILDGIICKAQHVVRVVAWMLLLAALSLIVYKVDWERDSTDNSTTALSWSWVLSPVLAVLSICSATLVYIVYGHQIGYYQLSEAQLTAGNLYSMASLLSIVLVVIASQILLPATHYHAQSNHQSDVDLEWRLLVVLLAPVICVLVGMGGWMVSRDEYGRLLVHGGQAQVHPRTLVWNESLGWTSVQGQGVTHIPMFGEVSFCPLEKQVDPTHPRTTTSTGDWTQSWLELCLCCTHCCGCGECYPEEQTSSTTSTVLHPYLSMTTPSSSAIVLQHPRAETVDAPTPPAYRSPGV